MKVNQYTGFHIDLRVQVMPIAALNDLARKVAAQGHNTLVLEWEASYPFREHAIISNKYAYTREEIEGFIALCGELGIEVIPLQQCFGHVEYILRHERYMHLRESDKDIAQLCPCKIEEAMAVFSEILDDVAATHPSEFIHIGGDETWLLGHCPACQEKIREHGKSRLYVDYFKRIADYVVSLGKRPVFWADMLLRYPDAAADMPRQSVLIDWNYGWPINRHGDIRALQAVAKEAGFEFWGAPALRSEPDNHSITCWDTHFNNLRDFLPFARESGYTGMIVTSWSTSGVYGYELDRPADFTEILPLRRVYPLNGFDVLIRALRVALDAVESGGVFDPQSFLTGYGQERFGLDEASSRAFAGVFATPSPVALYGRDLAAIHSAALANKQVLDALLPQDNLEEFAHLSLMADLREFHTRFKCFEAKLQSPWLTDARCEEAATALAALMAESETFDERFTQLNSGFLYPQEIAEEIRYRSAKLRGLYERLSRSGRSGFNPLHKHQSLQSAAR